MPSSQGATRTQICPDMCRKANEMGPFSHQVNKWEVVIQSRCEICCSINMGENFLNILYKLFRGTKTQSIRR